MSFYLVCRDPCPGIPPEAQSLDSLIERHSTWSWGQDAPISAYAGLATPISPIRISLRYEGMSRASPSSWRRRCEAGPTGEVNRNPRLHSEGEGHRFESCRCTNNIKQSRLRGSIESKLHHRLSKLAPLPRKRTIGGLDRAGGMLGPSAFRFESKA
jgi:hypothetical protein